MNRRTFLGALAATATAAAQEGAPEVARVEALTAPATPAIALNHLGFLPRASKRLVFRAASGPATFRLRDIGSSRPPFVQNHALRPFDDPFGRCLVGDFTPLERPAMYQVNVGDELSVPFFIRPDVWSRTLPKALDYYRWQRCGTEVPGVHPICHLDDARRRDDNRHVDMTGGWHDAGDLRKWSSTALLNGIGLLATARNSAALARTALDEFRWGNAYLLKLQDTDGRVWADTAGGVNGDNSDNHWTDNQPGTADDRYLNPAKSGFDQALFSTVEAMAARAFPSDAAYTARCREAARRCFTASPHTGGAGELAWWLMAAVELGEAEETARIAAALLALQQSTFAHDQKKVRGYWRAAASTPEPYVDPVYSALPPLALLAAANAYRHHASAPQWRDAVRLYVDEYLLPVTALSAYEVVPYGLFLGAPTPETYRPLAGRLTYRYFMPVRRHFWWLGVTAHLESQALLLSEAAVAFSQPRYRHLAFRQIEWVMGANPFAACLMTGEGMRNPYPHSRYVGLIPGAIMNGIAGNMADQPVLDMQYGFDWRTTEYWSPHNAFYLWSVSALHRG